MTGSTRDVVAAVPLPRAPGKVWVRAGAEPPARVTAALAVVAAAWSQEVAARRATQEAVAAAVRVGATWGRVATVVGLSVEGARCRYRAIVAAGAT